MGALVVMRRAASAAKDGERVRRVGYGRGMEMGVSRETEGGEGTVPFVGGGSVLDGSVSHTGDQQGREGCG